MAPWPREPFESTAQPTEAYTAKGFRKIAPARHRN
jgi:hypothetical protein